MIATQNPDHVAQGIALLVEQFKATVDLPKYLAVYLRQNQILEGVIWDVINKRMLGVAVGDQLDQLGDLVGEGRLGRNDTDYRAAVRLRIRVNRSQGRAEDVIQVANLASGNTAIYNELYPANFEVQIYNTVTPAVIARMLYSTKAAGTGGTLVYSITPDDGTIFKFDHYGGPIIGNVFDSFYPGATNEKFPAVVAISSTA